MKTWSVSFGVDITLCLLRVWYVTFFTNVSTCDETFVDEWFHSLLNNLVIDEASKVVWNLIYAYREVSHQVLTLKQIGGQVVNFVDKRLRHVWFGCFRRFLELESLFKQRVIEGFSRSQYFLAGNIPAQVSVHLNDIFEKLILIKAVCFKLMQENIFSLLNNLI